MADYNYEIAQVLYWAQEDSTILARLLQEPDALFADLSAAEFAVSDRAVKIFKRVNAGNFAAEYEKATSRFPSAQLQIPCPIPGAAANETEIALTPITTRDVAAWLREDEALRELFFQDATTAFLAIAQAGYTLTGDTRRQLRRLNRQNFQKRIQQLDPRTSTSAAPPAELETPSERIVNTGFATPDAAAQPHDPEQPLAPATSYYFWFEVGARVAGSIEVEDVPLPQLPADALLHVALFSFPGELEITPGEDVGIILVPAAGDVTVERRVAEPPVGEVLLQRRLFFPLHTPAAPGVYRLRCHLYYQQTLVQSRLVTAYVGQAPPATLPALLSEVDYTLSRALDGQQLHGMGANRLSLMLNDNGQGTHGFRYFGENEFKQDLTLGEGELHTLVRMARAALRRASWGDDDEYAPEKSYRYGGGQELPQLARDLILFAQRGYRFFADLITPLAGGQDPWEVMDWLRPPGQIQLASKRSVRLVLPLAMLYDHPFDDGLALADYSLCPTFINALQNGDPLAETVCFQGNCPSYGNDRVVCPSGFWGFRHRIGLPVTTDAAPDAPTAIPVGDKPGLAVNVYTDFLLLADHKKRLQQLNIDWELAESRQAALDLMKRTEAQAVYFYCHGGLVNDLPFLKVGHAGDDRLVANNLLNGRIRWRQVRPLIFINGCHTTALTPEASLDLVSAFVGISHAAGVIGTEITIFEETAVTFAETFFKLFLEENLTVGEAVRAARLAMLQKRNPLGLVYVPYVLPGLKLAKKP